MLDLDVVVMHDDALDDELQDRLPLGDARRLQPSGNPRDESRKAFKRCERALALFLQAAQLGVLLLGQSALGSQRLAPLGKLWKADHLRLVSLDQAAIGTLVPRGTATPVLRSANVAGASGRWHGSVDEHSSDQNGS